MAICPACKNQVSEAAVVCPHCSCNIEEFKTEQKAEKSGRKQNLPKKGGSLLKSKRKRKSLPTV